MSPEIIATARYVQQLQEQFSNLEVPTYKLKKLYSPAHQVFFDCERQDHVTCLETILKERQFQGFTVFVVIKEPSGAFKVMDIHFKNIGMETLEHFITRFHTALEPSTKLGLQIGGSEYLTCIGHSYSKT